MVKIGNYNTLPVVKSVDFGVYLDGGDGLEILLPSRFIDRIPQVGELMDVFIYTDSEDRIIATTEHPYAQVGEFAFLEAVSVDRIGAFLDWGLMKDLLVPFREQKVRMRAGKSYPVYLYLDDASKRVVASAKVEKFMGNVIPTYKIGDKVRIMVYRQTPIGYACVVDNLHQGMVYANEVFRHVELGECIDAYVKYVREDGKIDVTLSPGAKQRTDDLSDRILEAMQANGGFVKLNDKSSPEEIKIAFACSKKDFKKAVGHLLKERKIKIEDSGLLIFNDK